DAINYIDENGPRRFSAEEVFESVIDLYIDAQEIVSNRTKRAYRQAVLVRWCATMAARARQAAICAGVNVACRPWASRCSTARSQRRLARGRSTQSFTTRPVTSWRSCRRRICSFLRK